MGESGYYKHISEAGTHVVSDKPCRLEAIVINTTANGKISIYDNASGAVHPIAVIKANVLEQTLCFHDLRCFAGLTIVTEAGSDITVRYETI